VDSPRETKVLRQMMSRKAAIRAVSVAQHMTALAVLRTLPDAPGAPRSSLSHAPARVNALPPTPAPRSVHPTYPTEPLHQSAPDQATPTRDRPAVYPLVEFVSSIGRALDNSVTLPDPAVSRQHARLSLDESGWWIENISRRSPIWVGGAKVAPGERKNLVPGQTIQLGSTRLQLLASLHQGGGTSASPDVTLGSSLTALDGLGPLDPGVTLRFALRGRFSRGAGWALLALAFVIFAACAILTLDVAALAGEAALASGGLRQALTALAIPIAPALGVALVVGALDRYESEPLVMLAGAFLWGAIIAIPPALYFERGIEGLLNSFLSATPTSGGEALGQAAALAATAGGVEELVKGAGLLLLMLALRDEFDNVTDGVIYGALIGAGFAMVENIVYFAFTPRAELGFLIVGRLALGWLTHSTFTALFGAGLGYVRETRDRRARLLAPLGGLLGAIALHTYFDFIVYTASAASGQRASVALELVARLGPALPLLATLSAYLPLFLADLALLSITLEALAREAAIIRVYLATETLSGVVTPAEYLLVQDARLRARMEYQCGLLYGPRAYLLARALYQTETGLAFRKWHVEMGDPPKDADRQPEDAYRERIPRLRHALARKIAL
jgi:RsiW-degrading membrane proteinase PrsW (M82 family)